MAELSRKDKEELVKLLEEKERRRKQRLQLTTYNSLYDWQHKFNAATKDHTACLLMAANQIGKSLTGCIISSYHLTGDYPDDWEGHKYTRPIMAWMLGYSGEKTRDLLQQKLFGRLIDGKFEGGLIPAEKIIDYRAMTGTSGAMREIRVKHIKGTSTCQFWSYSQGQHALMGDVVDWYLVDEEPRDPDIYPQVVTRTINGDQGRGGRGILTFTPENGRTQLVCQFMDELSPSQYLQTATWDDAPHLGEEQKRSILAQYPAHQRDMRSKGVPLMGAGLIYQVNTDDLIVEPFEPPNYWFVIDGMDFGWDHPQAHIKLVWDKDNDTFYITNAWRAREKQPYEAWHIVKSWAQGVPTAWPADGLQTEKGSARQQRDYYVQEGFEMLGSHAQWEDGTNGVWAGIMELQNLMTTGRLKIFRPLVEVLEEVRHYHTITVKSGENIGKSKIVKTNDDLLDAIRYAYMMRRFAVRIVDLSTNEDYYDEYESHEGRSVVGGY